MNLERGTLMESEYRYCCVLLNVVGKRGGRAVCHPSEIGSVPSLL